MKKLDDVLSDYRRSKEFSSSELDQLQNVEMAFFVRNFGSKSITENNEPLFVRLMNDCLRDLHFKTKDDLTFFYSLLEPLVTIEENVARAAVSLMPLLEAEDRYVTPEKQRQCSLFFVSSNKNEQRTGGFAARPQQYAS